MSRINLTDALAGITDTTPPTKQAPPAAKPTKPAKKTSPRKKSSSSPTKASQPAKAKNTPAPTPAAQDTPQEPHEMPRRQKPRVRGVSTGNAVRFNLYIHPDDAKYIRTELRGGTDQAVFRSMIAVMRNNKKIAEQVAQLSLTAPRGEH